MNEDALNRNPLKILLIDDNHDLADITCSLLSHYGYTAESAYSGLSGLSKAAQFLPHVIICDINLPDIDGYEVARRIVEDSALRHIILIAVSGSLQSGDYAQYSEAGFQMHIGKPMNFEKLKIILDSLEAGVS